MLHELLITFLGAKLDRGRVLFKLEGIALLHEEEIILTYLNICTNIPAERQTEREGALARTIQCTDTHFNISFLGTSIIFYKHAKLKN